MSEFRNATIKALFDYGLKPIQIVALNTNDVAYDGPSMFLRIRRRSDSQDKYFFKRLDSTSQRLLMQYLWDERPEYGEADNVLFPNCFSTRMSVRAVFDIRRAAVADAKSKSGLMLYFVADEHGRIKVGSTFNLRHRLSSMQTDNADELTVLGTKSVSDGEEYELHRKFRHLHIRGEWFKAGFELLDYIESL